MVQKHDVVRNTLEMYGLFAVGNSAIPNWSVFFN